MINAFKERTGYGLVVNTSFNVRGEPIVCTPDDAYRCFMNTEMDILVIGDYVFKKISLTGIEILNLIKTSKIEKYLFNYLFYNMVPNLRFMEKKMEFLRSNFKYLKWIY